MRLMGEVVLWAICVTRNLPRRQFTPLVYAVGDGVPADLAEWLRGLGIIVKNVSSPVAGVPHCNRLVAFFDPPDVEYVIATDADLYFTANPAELFGQEPLLRAAPNNASNPPPRIFRRIFDEIGRGWNVRPWLTPQVPASGARETHINNISAGIVALPQTKCRDFASAWMRWAGWLNERRMLLEGWSGHIDQAAFALACEERGEDVVFLPPQANLVLHLLPHVDMIYALHISSAHVPAFAGRFHDHHLTTEGLAPFAAEAVSRLNDCIDEALVAMRSIPSIKETEQMFMNPSWVRS